MTKVTRKELVDNVLRPAFGNENFEDTLKEIIEMAKECSLIGMRPHLDGIYFESLEAFAKLVAEHEREACAKLCDLAMLQNQEAINELEDIDINITWNENSMRDFGKDELNFARAILRKAQEK